MVNGVDVGVNSPSYTATDLANGDKVSCFLNGNSVCVTTDTATSNVISISVVTPAVPTISISTPADSICLGTNVSFVAQSTTVSPTPAYQWAVNGVNAGTGGT